MTSASDQRCANDEPTKFRDGQLLWKVTRRLRRTMIAIAQSGMLQGLTDVDAKVFFLMLCHADFKTMIAWPSADTLAWESGYCRRSVWTAINHLVDLGRLFPVDEKGAPKVKRGGGRHVVTHFLVWPPPQTVQPSVHSISATQGTKLCKTAPPNCAAHGVHRNQSLEHKRHSEKGIWEDIEATEALIDALQKDWEAAIQDVIDSMDDAQLTKAVHEIRDDPNSLIDQGDLCLDIDRLRRTGWRTRRKIFQRHKPKLEEGFMKASKRLHQRMFELKNALPRGARDDDQ